MSESSSVKESIKQCIEKNGFPEKIVRLPFKAIYESCKKHGSALKEVLANLALEGIVSTVQGNFIEFRSRNKSTKKQKVTPEQNHSSEFKLPNMGNLKEVAQSYLSKMSPDQIKEMEKMVSQMSTEEKQKIFKDFSEQFFKGDPKK